MKKVICMESGVRSLTGKPIYRVDVPIEGEKYTVTDILVRAGITVYKIAELNSMIAYDATLFIDCSDMDFNEIENKLKNNDYAYHN